MSNLALEAMAEALIELVKWEMLRRAMDEEHPAHRSDDWPIDYEECERHLEVAWEAARKAAAWNYGGREVLLPYAVNELSRRHSGLPYVTHWQPLPAPPSPEEQKSGEKT